MLFILGFLACPLLLIVILTIETGGRLNRVATRIEWGMQYFDELKRLADMHYNLKTIA
jgi:hypothetical protein